MAVSYQTVYVWICPDCGATWQPRKRPRTGAPLVCAPSPEQQRIGAVEGPAIRTTPPCGTVHASSGHRKGIAPNVTL